MRLSVACRSCQHLAPVSEAARTRLDLERRVGREIRVPCPRCGHVAPYALDEVKASPGRTNAVVMAVAAAVAVGLTIWLWGRGWVSTVPLILGAGVYAAWATEARRRADAFNTFRVGRR